MKIRRSRPHAILSASQVDSVRPKADGSPEPVSYTHLDVYKRQPTLLYFKGGKVVNQMVGVRPKEELLEALELSEK